MHAKERNSPIFYRSRAVRLQKLKTKCFSPWQSDIESLRKLRSCEIWRARFIGWPPHWQRSWLRCSAFARPLPLAPMPLISLRHVSKRFGRNIVLQDVSLDIEAGKVVVVIGASGTGKSVLLKH